MVSILDSVINYMQSLLYNFEFVSAGVCILLLVIFIFVFVYFFTKNTKKKLENIITNEKNRFKNETSIFKKWSHIDIAECEKNGTLKKEFQFYTGTVMVINILSFEKMYKDMAYDKRKTETHDLIDLYYKIVNDCVKKTGGTIYNFQGWQLSAVWGVFSTSGTPDHDALNCARSALMIRLSLSGINKKLISHNKQPVRIACTISSGDLYSGYSEINQTISQAEKPQEPCKKSAWAMFGPPMYRAFNSDLIAHNNKIDILLSAYTRRLIKQYVIAEEIQTETQEKQFALINIRMPPGKDQPSPATLADVKELIYSN